MKKSFLKRGYKKPHLENQFSKAADKTRKQLFSKTFKAQNDNIPFVITFNKHLPNIRSAIDKHWDILKINPELEGTIYSVQKKPKSKGLHWSNNNEKQQSSTEKIQRKRKMSSLPHQSKQFMLSTK